MSKDSTRAVHAPRLHTPRPAGTGADCWTRRRRVSSWREDEVACERRWSGENRALRCHSVKHHRFHLRGFPLKANFGCAVSCFCGFAVSKPARSDRKISSDGRSIQCSAALLQFGVSALPALLASISAGGPSPVQGSLLAHCQ